MRTIAEWEELQALVVGWKSYPTILRQIVGAAKQETRVIVVYTTPDNPTSLTSYLAAGGVDTVNVTFLAAPVNSVWSRDYGHWSAYTNDVDSLITIDWIYNRPRPSDDAVPGVISNYLGTPLYQTTTAPWEPTFATSATPALTWPAMMTCTPARKSKLMYPKWMSR